MKLMQCLQRLIKRFWKQRASSILSDREKCMSEFSRDISPYKDTKAMHTVGHRYTDKRHALHMKIIKKIEKKAGSPKKGHPPVAVLIGGGTATGKTFIRKGIIQNKLKKGKIEAVTIDPDELKTYIPEYKIFKKLYPEQAARLVHRESCDIGAYLLNRLIQSRKHLIYEGTMARTHKYIKLVNQLKKDGYELQVFVADVSLKIAKQRAAERARRTGRKVPIRVIASTHRLVPLTVEAIKDHVDRYEVYDTEKGLTLIASNEYINRDRYARFLKKGEKEKKSMVMMMHVDMADDILNQI